MENHSLGELAGQGDDGRWKPPFLDANLSDVEPFVPGPGAADAAASLFEDLY